MTPAYLASLFPQNKSKLSKHSLCVMLTGRTGTIHWYAVFGFDLRHTMNFADGTSTG